MRSPVGVAVALLLASASPALAGDNIITAPPAAWVKPVANPAAPAVGASPVTILLIDQQVRLEPGATTVYSRQQIRIDSAAGLAAGNLSLSWQPDQQQITVHGVRLLRGKQVIDLLAKGQKFSVLRRETNLDQAMLDGMLTANLQSEGVEVGDIIELSASVTTRDPLLAGTAEMAIMPPPSGYQRYDLAMSWPAAMPLTTRATGGVVVKQLPEKDGMRGLTLSIDKPAVTDVPPNMPARMLSERRVEASSFADWAAAGALLAPLYAKASMIPTSGPLVTRSTESPPRRTTPFAAPSWRWH